MGRRYQIQAIRSSLTRIFNKTLREPIQRFPPAWVRVFRPRPLRLGLKDVFADGADGCRWDLVGTLRFGADGRPLPPPARPLAAGLVLISVMFAGPCRADDPVKGEATFSSSGGYARLVLKLAEDVESEVLTAGSIIVIRFKRPVDIPVDKLSDAVPDYVGSARRDPDGSAIRLSLQRRVTVNTMTAGERIFVDFLPDSWKGPPPSLPAESFANCRNARAPPSARFARSARPRRPGRGRRSGSALRCSRPLSASSSRCLTALACRRC